MPKAISDRERLVIYAMTADEDQLTEALELFRMALKVLKPAKQKKARTASNKKDKETTTDGPKTKELSESAKSSGGPPDPFA